MTTTQIELAEAIAQAGRRMDVLRGGFNLKQPDLDQLYEDCDRLLQQIGLARIIESSLIRQQIAQGANHG